MRRSTSYYPERVNLYCVYCEIDRDNVAVESIEGDDVRVECPECAEPTYVKVVD